MKRDPWRQFLTKTKPKQTLVSFTLNQGFIVYHGKGRVQRAPRNDTADTKRPYAKSWEEKRLTPKRKGRKRQEAADEKEEEENVRLAVGSDGL